MKVLVIGSGGREHALAWRLSLCPNVDSVFVAPGNAGTSLTHSLTNVALSGNKELASFARTEGIDLTVVGPEAPLSEGIVDAFRDKGLTIFGPTKAAAQLESSKDFAKAFMKRHNIPTADYATFESAKEAHDYIDLKGAPIVIKADGLAAGKGVVVAMTVKDAHEAIDQMLGNHKFGTAGARVVIEEFLEGEEASFIVMVDGEHVLPMASSQDHKRLLDKDQGPNTGGMGAYSPAPVVTEAIHEKVMREIILPTVRGMKEEGNTYTGFLYAGLMIGKDGSVKTLEFNCRFGDPETQPIMCRLHGDFAQAILLATQGRLNEAHLTWDPRIALGVVIAAKGYPEHPEKGVLIEKLPESDADCKLFHAGTKIDSKGNLVTSGGRVLCAVGLGKSFSQAQERAYEMTRGVRFAGAQYRSDIGYRAIAREKQQ